jgi:hypothetical protein
VKYSQGPAFCNSCTWLALLELMQTSIGREDLVVFYMTTEYDYNYSLVTMLPISTSTPCFRLNLVFPSQPCLSVSTLSFCPDLVFLIPNLEIKTSKAPSTSFGSLFESGHYDIRGWFERHSLVMMTLTADDNDDKVDLLIVKSKSALMCVPIACFKVFCEDNDLTVSLTGVAVLPSVSATSDSVATSIDR